MSRAYAWLDLDVTERVATEARRQGVSEVAAGPKGFLAAYRRAGGERTAVGYYSATQSWETRRRNFIARHMAQVRVRNEPLWRDGAPTRRHLALAVWAYSPTPTRLRAWIEGR